MEELAGTREMKLLISNRSAWISHEITDIEPFCFEMKLLISNRSAWISHEITDIEPFCFEMKLLISNRSAWISHEITDIEPFCFEMKLLISNRSAWISSAHHTVPQVDGRGEGGGAPAPLAMRGVCGGKYHEEDREDQRHPRGKRTAPAWE